MTFRLSKQAERDLSEINDYTALKWGESQSERYIHDLFAGFERLASNPELGRRRQDIPEPYLTYAVGSHLIIYRHNQAKSRVEVLNILHPKMDIAKRLRANLKS